MELQRLLTKLCKYLQYFKLYYRRYGLCSSIF